MSQKIFGVGLHKTGTTSLKTALEILGFRTGKALHVPPPLDQAKIAAAAIKKAEDFDFFTDLPWPLVYRDLDQAFPGSKFIMTNRDPQAWIASVVRHFGAGANDLHEFIYGVPKAEGNEQAYLDHYAHHNQQVRDYFKDRPTDFLELDFAKGDGWDKLCPFLDVAQPAAPFPHDNQNLVYESLWKRKLRKFVAKHILGRKP